MKIRLCPNCKSPNIIEDSGILTGNYHCKKCGYFGPIILELKKNPKK